jgi:DNA-binding LytR/AlgR family response regulator
MLRCFIADDEPTARQRLQRLLGALPEVCVVGEAADGVSALERLEACHPDVLLLDIAMPELDGLGVAAALAAAPAAVPAIIFVTAYDEHALRAFELSAVDYLVKPVRAERLVAALAKVTRRGLAHGSSAAELSAVLDQLQSLRPLRRMAARSGAKFIVFDPARVHGIVARDHYSVLLLDQQELIVDDSLDQLSRRFGAAQFLRVHRGAVINLALLRELVHEGDRRYVAVLADRAGTRVPVSRERLPALRAALGLD